MEKKKKMIKVKKSIKKPLTNQSSLDNSEKVMDNKKKKIIIGVVAAVVALVVIGFILMQVFLGPVDSKNGVDKEVNIPQGSSLSSIATTLKENELIKSEFAFKVYVKLTGKADDLQAGYYGFSQKESASKIAKKIATGDTSGASSYVTINEGFDLNRMGNAFEQSGIFTKEEFLKEIKENKKYYKEKYDFLSSVPNDREYILEGYLFADTYQVNKTTTPRQVIENMLDRFDREYTDEYKKRTKEMGKTIDEIVTMASIVEREGILDSELPTIAGVFYNRLEDGMMLQSCATLQYIYQDYQFSFTESQKNIDSPYNTYKYAGLPAGPIASFRAEALKAALYPEDNNYLYFCTKNDGTGASAFAKNYADHQANIEKYSENWE